MSAAVNQGDRFDLLSNNMPVFCRTVWCLSNTAVCPPTSFKFTWKTTFNIFLCKQCLFHFDICWDEISDTWVIKLWFQGCNRSSFCWAPRGAHAGRARLLLQRKRVWTHLNLRTNRLQAKLVHVGVVNGSSAPLSLTIQGDDWLANHNSWFGLNKSPRAALTLSPDHYWSWDPKRKIPPSGRSQRQAIACHPQKSI